jgi:hypothetical protein
MTDLSRARCVTLTVVGGYYVSRCKHPAKMLRPVRLHGGPAGDFTLDLPVCGIHARRQDAGNRDLSAAVDVRDALAGGAS